MTFQQAPDGIYDVFNVDGLHVGIFKRPNLNYTYRFWAAPGVRFRSGELAAIADKLDALNDPRQPVTPPETAKPAALSEAQHFYQAHGEVAP